MVSGYERAPTADQTTDPQASADPRLAVRGALGDAVGALAARLRRDGAPPERMLVLVKDAARAATPPGADPPAARDLMAHAVRRGIEAYFAA